MTHHSDSNTPSSGPQHPGRSQEGEQKLATEETVKRSTRCDGSRHSILETLGQTQSGGEDGDEVGCGEFRFSNLKARRDTKYPGEQTGGVRIVQEQEQTITSRIESFGEQTMITSIFT